MNQKKINKSKESVSPTLNRELKKEFGERVSETLDVLNLLKVESSILGEYWYLAHNTVQLIKSELFTMAALDIQAFLPKDISYKKFLEDIKKHKDWNHSTKELSSIRQRISRERTNVTKLIIDDIIKMQIDMGFAIEDEIIKYDNFGNKVGLSRKPSSRKIRMLNKQLGLGELFTIYQMTVYTYNDFENDQGETVRPFRFSDEQMKLHNQFFKIWCPKDELKNSLLERVSFNQAMYRFYELINYDEPLFASTLLYLVNLYINDKSWWYWRDPSNFVMYHSGIETSHTVITTNIAVQVMTEMNPNLEKHRKNEQRFLRKIADSLQKSPYNSLNDFIKAKYFKF